MSKVSEKLDERILEAEEHLSNLTPGTDSYSAAAESLNKLYRLRLDEIKADLEYKERFESRKLEERKLNAEKEFKRAELKAQKKDRIFRYCIDIGASLLPFGGYLFLGLKGLEFETTGSITSPIIRAIFTGFKPTRK